MIDKFVMLKFLAAREDAQPGVYLSANGLFAEAAHLEPQPSLTRNSITRALADLRRLKWGASSIDVARRRVGLRR